MSEAPDIIAMSLDQAPNNTGWAIGRPLEMKPKYGLFTLPSWGDVEGERLCDFHDWLQDMLVMHAVTHVFYEAPAEYQGKSFGITSNQNMQIGAIHMAVCRVGRERVKVVPLEQATAHSWRKRFLGVTKPLGITGPAARTELKKMAVKACAIRNWYVDSEDIAEALGILDFGLSTLSIHHASNRDTLFGRAEWANDVARFRGEQ